MAYLGGMEPDEREMLHDLVRVFIEKLHVQQRLSEDLARKLAAANERLELLEASNYGLF